jgi:phosphoribosylformylglycinamidine synthase
MVELGLVDKLTSKQVDKLIANGAESSNLSTRQLVNSSTKIKMLHNDSRKFESGFVTLSIPQNDSVMFRSLSGSKLGIWVAHGEGRFSLPEGEEHYNVVAKYNHHGYPANPNGSDFDVAGICSADGRHLAMMPHLERALFPWQNAWYPLNRRLDEVTPWMEAFVNARKWIEEKGKKVKKVNC